MTNNLGSRSPGRGLHFGALQAGYSLGQYRLHDVLGVGGFGITYRAVDEKLRRPVAVKEYLPSDFAMRVSGMEVRPRSPADQEMFTWGLTRFLDEARVLAALNDAPNIVHVYDYLEANGTGYMVMELIEGEPLDKLVARVGKIPAQSILPLLPSLLKGLEAVHRAGYLHRDIKPANVLVRSSGEPVLVDFGAARMSMGQRTQVMTSIYSPGYAPPEQYAFGTEANKQGPWSDIYALAATLHHAITGAAPPDSVRRLAKDSYVPLTKSAAGQYPPGFLAAIDAALSLSIDRRPQSVAAWSQMLFGDNRAPPSGPAPAPVPAFAPPAHQSRAGPASMGGPPPASWVPPYGAQAGQWPGGAFDAAIASQRGPSPGASYRPQPAVPFDAAASQRAAATPARRGAGLWIAIGILVALLAAGGAGAYFYLCVLNDFCSDGLNIDDEQRRLEQEARERTRQERERREREERERRERQPEPSRPPIPAPAPTPPSVPPADTTVPTPSPPSPPTDTTAPTPPAPSPSPPTDTSQPVPAPPVVTKPAPDPAPPRAPEPTPPPPAPPVVTKPAPAPPPPVATKPAPPPPAPPRPTAPDPTGRRFIHEGQWFGSGNLVRGGGQGGCPPAFTLSGVVSDNIFRGTSSLGGSASIRVRSNTKRVADLSLPGMAVRSTNGTFEAFSLETTAGCIYAIRMFRQ